jgi:hypothetical protein
LAERILRSLAGDAPAGGLLPRDRAQRWRSPALNAGNLLFLTVIGIVGAATAGSLFAAGFLLLMHPKAALRPAALNAVRAQPAPSRVLVVAAAAAKSPSPVSPKAAPAPHAAEAPRIAPAAPPGGKSATDRRNAPPSLRRPPWRVRRPPPLGSRWRKAIRISATARCRWRDSITRRPPTPETQRPRFGWAKLSTRPFGRSTACVGYAATLQRRASGIAAPSSLVPRKQSSGSTTWKRSRLPTALRQTHDQIDTDPEQQPNDTTNRLFSEY